MLIYELLFGRRSCTKSHQRRTGEVLTVDVALMIIGFRQMPICVDIRRILPNPLPYFGGVFRRRSRYIERTQIHLDIDGCLGPYQLFFES